MTDQNPAITGGHVKNRLIVQPFQRDILRTFEIDVSHAASYAGSDRAIQVRVRQ